MLNKFAAIGRLTRDPDMRATQTGKTCAHFTVACDRDFGQDPTTDFLDCVAWGNTAEFCRRNLTKGRLVAVTGSVNVREWTDKEGKKRKAYEIAVRDVYPLDKKEPALEPIDEPDGELPF